MEAIRERREWSERPGTPIPYGRCLDPQGDGFRLVALLGLGLGALLYALRAFGEEPLLSSVSAQLDPFAEPTRGSSETLSLPGSGTAPDIDLKYPMPSPDSQHPRRAGNPESYLASSEQNSVLTAECWTWQLLPDGVIYSSYLAGTKEPRFASVWNHDAHLGWKWDLEAGGVRACYAMEQNKDLRVRTDGNWILKEPHFRGWTSITTRIWCRPISAWGCR